MVSVALAIYSNGEWQWQLRRSSSSRSSSGSSSNSSSTQDRLSAQFPARYEGLRVFIQHAASIHQHS